MRQKDGTAVMARSVDQKKAVGYITKAKNSLHVSKIAVKEAAYDAAVMNVVHSAINSLDALTTYFVGKRASGAHTEVLSLVKGILTQREYEETQKQYNTLLGMKNESEYQPDLMSLKESESAIKLAERIFDIVQNYSCNSYSFKIFLICFMYSLGVYILPLTLPDSIALIFFSM